MKASSHTRPSPRTPLPKPADPAQGGRRERRRAEIHERLFRAALGLFAQKGFAETTVEDITNAADVGKGTFFNYFPSKEHVLGAFGEMQLGKLASSVAAARETAERMPEFLQRLTRVMTEEPGRNPGVVRTILLANLTSSPVRELVGEKLARGRQLLAELIEIFQRRGEVRVDVPALEMARAFQQAAFGTLMMWSVAPDEPLEKRMASTMELLWTGFRKPVSAAPAGGA